MLRQIPHAKLVLRTRYAYACGTIEIVVWAGPQSVPPSDHGFEYRLVFIRGGEPVVGYDNERGKGDRRHIGTAEKPYPFVDVPTLLEDSMREVEASN